MIPTQINNHKRDTSGHGDDCRSGGAGGGAITQLTVAVDTPAVGDACARQGTGMPSTHADAHKRNACRHGHSHGCSAIGG